MKNMLIVDDEKAIIQTIKTYFEDNGYNVLSATSAKAAEEDFSKELLQGEIQ